MSFCAIRLDTVNDNVKAPQPAKNQGTMQSFQLNSSPQTNSLTTTLFQWCCNDSCPFGHFSSDPLSISEPKLRSVASFGPNLIRCSAQRHADQFLAALPMDRYVASPSSSRDVTDPRAITRRSWLVFHDNPYVRLLCIIFLILVTATSCGLINTPVSHRQLRKPILCQ